MAVFENRQPVTAAKFINKSSLFILLLGVIRQPEQKLIAHKKQRIYSSPRHIAKPIVSGSGFSRSASLIKRLSKFQWRKVGFFLK